MYMNTATDTRMRESSTICVHFFLCAVLHRTHKPWQSAHWHGSGCCVCIQHILVSPSEWGIWQGVEVSAGLEKTLHDGPLVLSGAWGIWQGG